MKTKKQIASIILMGFSLITLSCDTGNTESKEKVVIKQSDIVSRTFEVKGMTCVGCEVTLEENVSKIEGVVSTRANHSEDKLTIEFDSTKTNSMLIKETIKESGYKVY